MSKSGGPNLNPASNRRSNPPSNLPADKDPVSKPEPILDTPTVSGKSPVIGPPNGGTAKPAPKQQPNRTPTFNEPDDDPAYAAQVLQRLLDEYYNRATPKSMQDLQKIPRFNAEYTDYWNFLRDRAGRVPRTDNIYAKYSYLKEIDSARFRRVASTILGLGPKKQVFNQRDDDYAYSAMVLKVLRQEYTETKEGPVSTLAKVLSWNPAQLIWSVIEKYGGPKNLLRPRGEITTRTLTPAEQEAIIKAAYGTRYDAEYAEWNNWVRNDKLTISPGNTFAKYAYMKLNDYNKFKNYNLDAAYEEYTKFSREIVSEVVVRSIGYALGGWMTNSMGIIDYIEWFAAEFGSLYILQDVLIDNSDLVPFMPREDELPVGFIAKAEDIVGDAYANMMDKLRAVTQYRYTAKTDVLPNNPLAMLYRVLAESIIAGGLYKGINVGGEKLGADRLKLAEVMAKVLCSSIMGVFYSLADNYFVSRKAIMAEIEKQHKASKVYQAWGVGPILEFFADAFDYAWTYKEAVIPSVIAVVIIASAITYRLRSMLTGA